MEHSAITDTTHCPLRSFGARNLAHHTAQNRRRKVDLAYLLLRRLLSIVTMPPQFGPSAEERRALVLDKRKIPARRSTRLPLQFPVILTSLDPAYFFSKECTTAFVNAHGCGVIVPHLLNNQTPVTVKLVSNGAVRNGRVVLAIPLLENFSWLLGVEFDCPGNFWGVENPPADWRL